MRFYQAFNIEPRKLREKGIWTLQETMGYIGDLLIGSISTSTTVEGKIKAIETVIAGCLSAQLQHFSNG